MKVCLQVCRARNGTIGRGGEVPWYVKGMNSLSAMSEGYPVIMGRKTAGPLALPLYSRTNILITSDKNYTKEGFHIHHDSDSALDFAKSMGAAYCFVLGGGSIFRQFLPYADIIHLATLAVDFEGDTFFPKNFDEKFAKKHSVSYNSNIDFVLETYERT